MHSYIIARVNIDDPDTFHRYEQAFADVFREYHAEVLVADDAVRILEGQWPAMRTAVIRFESEAEALRFYYSEKYQKALQIRLRAARVDLILAKGFVADGPA